MKRWSKLQKKFYSIIDEKLDLQLHLSIYRMKTRWGSTDLPRYWLTLGKDIIFDYPKQFMDEYIPVYHYHHSNNGIRTGEIKYINANWYPYGNNISDISYFIDEYINTPRSELLTKNFENDSWGLSNIFKVSDRRIGKRALKVLKGKTGNTILEKIIELRLEN